MPTTSQPSEADLGRVLVHIRGRSISHPETGATGLYDMPNERFRACVDVLRERGHDIVESIVTRGDRAGDELGYILRRKTSE